MIRTPDRDALSQFLKSRAIGSLIHYPTPIHLQQAYGHLGYKRGDFPASEKAASEVLSLPLYPTLTEEEAVSVSTAVKVFYAR